jgi:hypothetical protein
MTLRKVMTTLNLIFLVLVKLTEWLPSKVLSSFLWNFIDILELAYHIPEETLFVSQGGHCSSHMGRGMTILLTGTSVFL